MVTTVAVGTDGSRTAGEAVEMAADRASRSDARLIRHKAPCSVLVVKTT
jgi:nucleotide-binding universal stress UspA family protein